jgi:hypothetical protein
MWKFVRRKGRRERSCGFVAVSAKGKENEGRISTALAKARQV